MRAPDRCESALAAILVTSDTTGDAPRCAVVKERLLTPRLRALAKAAAGAAAGSVVVYAIPVEGSIAARLITLLTLRMRVGRAHDVLRRAGAVRIHHYAVTPSLERPTVAYEVGTPAAEYADRHLRPTSGSRLHRFLARVVGIEPSIGGVLVAGLKA